MKRILVAIDFGDREEFLVNKAIEIGKKFDSEIVLIHATAPDPDFVSFDAGPQTVRDQRAETLHKERKIMELLVEKVKTENLKVKGFMVQGSTVDVLLKEADNFNADVIILGHKKLGFLEKFIRGSVSSGILQNAKIPVYSVPVD